MAAEIVRRLRDERGSIRFGLPATAESVDLATGDRLELPAGTRHDATVSKVA